MFWIPCPLQCPRAGLAAAREMEGGRQVAYTGLSFRASDLLSRDPSLGAEEVEPVRKGVCRQHGVPEAYEEVVEAFVPEETPGEEGPAGDLHFT